MALNSLSALNPDKWVQDTQDYLNAMLVLKPIANFQFKSDLIAGDTLDFPTISEPRVQGYTASTDATIDPSSSVSDKMLVDQSRISTYNVDPTEVRQALDKGYPQKLSRQAAHVIAQEMDQNVIGSGVTSAYNTVGTTASPVTLSSSNIFQNFSDSMAELASQNAADGAMFAVVDPFRVSVLAQSELANGFNKADSALANGFVGTSSTGFKVYTSNNLPSTVDLTMDTNPTAGDTLRVGGVTFTFVATGTAAAAGEVSIAAGLAATQTSLEEAVNGTGTPGAANYIEVSVDDRRTLQNRQIAMGVFATDVATVTGFGRQNNQETFTAGTNVFGTELMNMLFGRQGALSVGMQMTPSLDIRPEPRNLSENYLVHTLYGHKVYLRDQKRLLNMTVTA